MSVSHSFTENELRDWATFSGDWNPIHFDHELARKNGLDSTVVHGMLAMLQAKKMACDIIDDSNIEINFSLRKPIPLQQEMIYELNKLEKHTNLSIKKGDSGETFYISSIKESSKPLVMDDKATIHRDLPSDFVNEKRLEFSENYPDIPFDWIFLDALIFAIYVEGNGGTSLAKDTQEFLGSEVYEKEFAVYQISHKVTIARKLVGKTRQELSGLSYATKGVDLVRMTDSVYGSVDFCVLEDDEAVMKIGMGLMVKFLEKSKLVVDMSAGKSPITSSQSTR
ncbi:MaoC/PaaZ C-terminal domain-containing protein [Pseudoalteromonas sp. OF7H-1]|uniref:MaoC/PaaZ C-terminal domain-containing protein n=1 Tax=Pseudoalteromonas sp. OF7H-1 TaxID=2917755 RepID=UPI001EF52ADA|nr:MaoC/PaaZ C-terminal domain-containing protein [Pseudoalteromonas sp. OF7H-1]MCG7539012.1 hypothetical protein [Pseudoalteromonas sp. OF7H-1]